jgi:hypothetical protein
VIEQKFAAYLTILQQRRYEQHFNVANFIVLFVAPHPARKLAMMNLLERLTHGKDSQHLLAAFGFQVFPTILSVESQPRPYGWAITKPWDRVGHPPLDLSTA